MSLLTLVIALLAFATAAFASLELLARVHETRGSVVVAGAVGILAVAPAQLGRPFDSVVAGAFLTSLVCAPLAFLGVRRFLRSAVVDDAAADAGARYAFLAGTAVIVALGAWVSFGARLWDGELGHYGFSSGIARGVLPPEHPLFPGEPLRYHVGFDVVVALLVAADIPVGIAVELVSCALLALLCFAVRNVARALTSSPAAAALAVLVVPLGYGTLSFCLAQGWGSPLCSALGACDSWFPSSWVGAPRMPPAVIANFFQHPQGIAMPLALAALLVATGAPHSRSSTSRTALAAAFLALLTQCQVVFFALTGLAVGAVVVVAALRERRFTQALARALLLALPLAVALAGSFLAGGGAVVDELRFGRGYFAQDGALALIAHHLALFGFTILALPVALVTLRKASSSPAQQSLRLALLIAGTAGFVVANTFTYARSWDIVKFFAVGSFFANFLVVDAVACWLSSTRTRRAVGAVVVALSIASYAFWLVRHGPLNGIVAFHYALRPPSALGEALLAAHGDAIGARDVVLTRRVDIWHQGLHVAGADWRTHAVGQLVDRARADARLRLAKRALADLDESALRELGVRWLLLGDDDVARLGARLDAHERVGRVKDMTLYRVTATQGSR